MSTISLIITTYKNESSTLKRCIESCLPILNENNEIIIVNNNDLEDHYYHFVYELSKQYNGLKVVDTEKASNAQIARNIGLANSSNDFVKFIDDDDEINAEGIIKIVDICAKNGYDVAYGRINHIKIGIFNKLISNIFSIVLSFINLLIVGKPNTESQKLLMVHQMSKRPNTLSTIFSREFLVENNGWNEEYKKIQDFELVMRLSKKTDFLFCDIQVGNYYHIPKTFSEEHANNITKYTLQILEDNIDVISGMNSRVKVKTFIKFYLFGMKKNASFYRNRVFDLFYRNEKNENCNTNSTL